ncbi:hypothetical protein [Pseudomonas sp. CC120222-01a]|uniref:hypothetical protein n=1 Tax=Pseudomonas sp. CC120222-01a TaxID=1378075 RepID=UPI000D89BB90|nr:hypothetical protein [Pseudomonas sp. CC120222-01a]PVZ39486.1 hypothetical protein N430_03721 [Pseudomonas sp. CC120222-01a]
MNDNEDSVSADGNPVAPRVRRATLDALIVDDELIADRADNTVFRKYLTEPDLELVVVVENPWQLPGSTLFQDELKLIHLPSGTELASDFFKKGDETRFPFSIIVPKDFIERWGEGVHTFGYEVEHGHGEFSDSLPLELIFDRKAPYDQTPPKKMADIAPVTEANKDKVVIELPDYADFKPKDRVAVWWLDASVSEIPEDLDPHINVPVTSLPQNLSVPEAVIDDAGDGGIAVVYVLIDKALNRSNFSYPTYIGVALGDPPANLKAPVVPQAAKGQIIKDDAFAGVIVQVLGFDNWKPKDELRVIWGGQPATEWRAISDTSQFPVVPVEFTLSKEVLYADYGVDGTGEKDTEVTYELRRGTVPQGKMSTTVKVNLERFGPVDPVDPEPVVPDPENKHLEPVNITGKSGEQNHLTDPDDEFEDATLTLVINDTLEPLDVLTFYWGNALIAGIEHEVKTGEPGNPMPPKTVSWDDVIKPGRNGNVPVHYRVERPGNPNPIRSRDTNVLVEAVGVYPVEPEFLGVVQSGGLTLLTCQSIYEDADDTDPAVRVQVDDLSQYGLVVTDEITMHWSAVHGDGEDGSNDPVDGALYEPVIPLDEKNINGFVWKIPFETYVKQVYTPSQPEGRGRVKISFTVDGKLRESAVREVFVVMHNGIGSCPLRPKP